MGSFGGELQQQQQQQRQQQQQQQQEKEEHASAATRMATPAHVMEFTPGVDQAQA